MRRIGRLIRGVLTINGMAVAAIAAMLAGFGYHPTSTLIVVTLSLFVLGQLVSMLCGRGLTWGYLAAWIVIAGFQLALIGITVRTLYGDMPLLWHRFPPFAFVPSLTILLADRASRLYQVRDLVFGFAYGGDAAPARGPRWILPRVPHPGNETATAGGTMSASHGRRRSRAPRALVRRSRAPPRQPSWEIPTVERWE